jgi:uncharacterized membrane protein (DUF485 family)
MWAVAAGIIIAAVPFSVIWLGLSVISDANDASMPIGLGLTVTGVLMAAAIVFKATHPAFGW